MGMTITEYQGLARRTQNTALTPDYRLEHATWGLAAEVGEVLGLFQKTRQGHQLDREKVIDEVGDTLWFVAEMCDCIGVSMEEVAARNIEKLRKRFPDGFSSERSINREV